MSFANVEYIFPTNGSDLYFKVYQRCKEEEELRAKHKGLQTAWEQYQIVLQLVKVKNDVSI